MSPEQTPTPGQPAGTGQAINPPTAAPTAGTESGGQGGVKGEIPTRAEVEAMVEGAEKRAIAAAYKRIDQGRERVDKAVKAVADSVALLRASGKEITPAEEKTLKDAAAQKAANEPEPPPTPEGQLPPQAEGPTIVSDPEILAIQQEHGVELYDGDPELSMLKRDKGMRAWYKSIEDAVIAKKTRQASQPENLTNPASRSAPVGNPPMGITPEMSAHDAWSRVEHKK